MCVCVGGGVLSQQQQAALHLPTAAPSGSKAGWGEGFTTAGGSADRKGGGGPRLAGGGGQASGNFRLCD